MGRQTGRISTFDIGTRLPPRGRSLSFGQMKLELAELGSLIGGLDYAVGSKGIARFDQRLICDDALSKGVTAIQKPLSK